VLTCRSLKLTGRRRVAWENGVGRCRGVTRRDDTAARTEAPHIGRRLEDYRRAAQALRSQLMTRGELTQDLVETVERAAAIARERAESHFRELREAGRKLPDRLALQRTISELSRALSPAETRILRTFITDAQAPGGGV
jgi:hypothetical protein